MVNLKKNDPWFSRFKEFGAGWMSQENQIISINFFVMVWDVSALFTIYTTMFGKTSGKLDVTCAVAYLETH